MSDIPCVCGIDPSLTGTAVAFWPQDVVYRLDPVPPPKSHKLADRMLRYDKLTRQIEQLMLACRPQLVCIEGYSLGSKGSALSGLIEYGWSIRTMLTELAARYSPVEISPSELKKFATGKGTADKLAVCLALQKRYGKTFTTNDEYDAYALARLAAVISGMEEGENEQQRAVAGKLRSA